MKKELVQASIDKLLQMFKTQDFPAAVGWQVIRRRSGDHPIPSDSWSAGNRWLMLASGTTDARGFGQWHQIGRQIIPGSKALYICAPNTMRTAPKDDDDTESPRQIVKSFRWIPVFRIQDSTGKEVFTADYTPAVLQQELPTLLAVANKLGVSVNWQPFDGKALGRYRPGSKEIFLSEQSYLTMAHELMHHLDSQVEPIKASRLCESELIAEFGGSVLSSIHGITGYESSSYRYLKSYAANKEPEAVLRCIMAVAARVEKLVGVFLDAAAEATEADSKSA